ncbi:DUF1731 domain-containing protein [Cohnella zeiphila]|uniref:DUF1731 domain-containing protein n=1 Tax=Cohnella zeiphila TaxID=2761120 RepID=A0A7X0VV21_9BACL|nr:DUF1731 domain-containing protein [Cohnella zeiphila]MBB6730975.1 DUF1731 domain-containing protein [Cohnella zeiphila]
MRVMLCGGTGFIGTALSEALLERGDEVWIVTRQLPAAPAAGLLYVTWEEWSERPERWSGIDAIVCLSGETISKRWTEEAKRRILVSRTQTALHIADIVKRMPEPPKVLVNASGISLYGHSYSPIVKPEFAPKPKKMKMKKKRDDIGNWREEWEAEQDDRPRPFVSQAEQVGIRGFTYGARPERNDASASERREDEGVADMHPETERDALRSNASSPAEPPAAGPQPVRSTELDSHEFYLDDIHAGESSADEYRAQAQETQAFNRHSVESQKEESVETEQPAANPRAADLREDDDWASVAGEPGASGSSSEEFDLEELLASLRPKDKERNRFDSDIAGNPSAAENDSIPDSEEPGWFDENDPPQPEDLLGRTIIAWEEAVDQIPVERIVKLRISLVLGRNGGTFPLLRLPYRFFVGGRMGSGTQGFPWIHLQDLVSLFLFSLDRPDLSGPVNAVAPDPVNNDTFGRTLARVTRRPHWLHVPPFVLQKALGEQSVLLLTGQHAYPRKALEHGFTFAFPKLEDALRDLTGRHSGS